MKRYMMLAAAALCLHASAQNQEDIFRYSFRGINGTTRSLGLSGAWGAAGADQSAASNNPAGLALYRRNEVMGSLGLVANLTNTSYLGNATTDGKTVLNIPNLGFVYFWNQQRSGAGKQMGPVGATFAFGVNRVADFNSNIQYAGNGTNTTIGDALARIANGTDSANMWDNGLNNDLVAQAWRLRLIDNYGGSSNYASIMQVLGDTDYVMRQMETIRTSGRINEWYAGGGVNFEDIVFLGASVVVQSVTFSSERLYREYRVSGNLSSNPYEQSQISQKLNTNGMGVGGKLGIIVRPSDYFRVGLAYHTPVRINLTDVFQNSTEMWYNGKFYSENGIESENKYQVITPGRIQVNSSFFAGKFMVLNVDYEWVDYRNGRISPKNPKQDFSFENQANRDQFAQVHNLRTGVEFALGYMRLRGGYALLGNPYNSQLVRAENGNSHVISGGFGWIYDNAYFFDIAVSDRIGKDYITPYEGIPTSAVNSYHRLNFQIGAGYRF